MGALSAQSGAISCCTDKLIAQANRYASAAEFPGLIIKMTGQPGPASSAAPVTVQPPTAQLIPVTLNEHLATGVTESA
jgi:hypothetical protein